MQIIRLRLCRELLLKRPDNLRKIADFVIVNSVENQLNRLVLCVREVNRISEINFDGIERTLNALAKSQPHN